MNTNNNQTPKTGIAVDASVIGGNPGQCEVKGVDIETGEVVFCESIGIATNNIAEYIAIAYAYRHLEETKTRKIVYSDSQICINWVYRKQGCKTKFFEQYPEKAKLNLGLTRLIVDCEKVIMRNRFNLLFWSKKKFGLENPADFGRK